MRRKTGAGQTQGSPELAEGRVYRIMAADRLLLARRYTERPDYGHHGVVVAIRSNLRWCSDGFEFTCWNGEVVRDIMLEAVETRFGGMRAETPTEMLSDYGSAYTAAKHAPLPGSPASNPASRPFAARSPTAFRRPSCIPSNGTRSASHRCPMHSPR
ncbi:hypothetical protein GCM10022253_30890 [Sphingomonas endophytica]|uniref:Transposase InsO family protein n=1 Tax=Sphingomonas endophytica TaxID=869719 RepID=A0ABR6N6X1_9SPHN|nr:transposase InsO family protein [Sphingomonas endophytica]